MHSIESNCKSAANTDPGVNCKSTANMDPGASLMVYIYPDMLFSMRTKIDVVTSFAGETHDLRVSQNATVNVARKSPSNLTAALNLCLHRPIDRQLRQAPVRPYAGDRGSCIPHRQGALAASHGRQSLLHFRCHFICHRRLLAYTTLTYDRFISLNGTIQPTL